MVAAGIPLLLHLLNLRRLKTVEFSTLRFLQELQQTQMRRLKLQQLLLLLLRTLLIVFAVLAFARPTIPSNLPLLSGNARSSVVILVDNSGSMEAADQRGQRLQQAKDYAKRLISMLHNGDEVCVLPMVNTDLSSSHRFTRTFDNARSQVDAISLNTGRANLSASIYLANQVMEDAAYAHHEVFIVSDAQATNLVRADSDTGTVLHTDASVFLLRVGDGLTGLEQNLSIDSLHLISKLPQSNRPVEIEAFIRNGSTTATSGTLVSLAFQGVRAAQRTLDIPAGSTRSVVLSAPPQRAGAIAVSVELEPDAVSADNIRYLGLTLAPPARTAVVGNGTDATLVATALSLPAVQQNIGPVRTAPTFAAIRADLQALDVVYLVDGKIEDYDVTLLRQFVERGGGLVVFANTDPEMVGLLGACGLEVHDIREANQGSSWSIRSVDNRHPLLEGVFRDEKDRTVVETARIIRQLVVHGGTEVAATDVGPLLSEGTLGAGRVIAFAVGIDQTWGTFAYSGFFPAMVVRSAVYLSSIHRANINEDIGKPIAIQLPMRYAGEPRFKVTDVMNTSLELNPVHLSSGAMLHIGGQPKPGVVLCNTASGIGVAAISVNAPTEESELNFVTDDLWLRSVKELSANPSHVVLATGRSVADAIRTARQGSELWPLCIVIALLCAVSESLVARYAATDKAATSP